MYEKIFKALDAVVQADPKLAEQVLGTVKEIFKLYVNQSGATLEFYQVLTSIGKTDSKLADQIFDMDVRYGAMLFVYRDFMKSFPLEETIAKHPQIEQDLRLVHKGRFASNEEFEYAISHFSKEELADSMIFSAQQRVMNVIVSASAQEAGITKEAAQAFRRPDAPEIIKEYINSNRDWLIAASFKGLPFLRNTFPHILK